MEVTPTENKSKTIELSKEAFDAFCEDISGMFGVDMKCVQLEVCSQSINDLKKRFKKLTAIDKVKANGRLEGVFHLIFDQGGLFTLSGIVVMLPENRILEEIKRGTIKDVQSMNDAISEVGNLCVGSWDRVFREEFEGHGHFLQDGTYIGNPWDNPEEAIGLSKDTQLLFVSFEMTVESFPSFRCGVVFPENVFVSETKNTSEHINEKQEKVDESETGNDESHPVGITESESEVFGDEQDNDNKESKRVKENINPPETDNAQEVPEVRTESQYKDASENSARDVISSSIRKLTKSQAILPGEDSRIFLLMTAEEIMDRNVIWCSIDSSVEQAIEIMQRYDTGYLMAGDKTVPEGILSRSDLSGALSPYLRTIFSKWRRPLDDATLQIRVKWIMSRPVRMIKPNASIIDIMETMRRFGNRCLPVINHEGKVTGLVTVFDIFKTLNSKMSIQTVGRTSQPPLLL